MTAVHNEAASESTRAARGTSAHAFTSPYSHDAAIGVLLKALYSGTTVPILANVLLEYNGQGQCRIATTDLETTVTIVFPVQSESGAFKVTINAMQFAKFIKGSKTGFSLAAASDGESVVLTVGAKRITLPALPAIDYPPVKTKRPEIAHASFASPLASLQKALTTVAHFASTEEARGAVLMSVCIQTKVGLVVATDGYALVHDALPGVVTTTPETTPWENLIVPRVAIRALAAIKIPKGIDAPKVIGDAYSDGGAGKLMLRTTVGDVRYTIVTRLVDGQYPNYQQVIPTAYDRAFRVKRKALIDLVKTAGQVASDRSNRIDLRSTYGDGTLNVSASSNSSGEFSSDLSIENIVGTNQVDTAFNALFLAKILEKAFDTEEVEMQYVGPMSPMSVVVEGTRLKAVLMPLNR